ncbi:MAG: DUF739 family protein [Turicibacter sp.]|nr:DUF739 family protein [Turicibacter sp.]
MNINKLKAKIVEQGLSYKDVYEDLGLSKTAFLSKMNGKTQFKLSELRKIVVILDLNQSELKEIFFK